jgi:hypothetical protein
LGPPGRTGRDPAHQGCRVTGVTFDAFTPPSLTLLEINMRERDDRERVIATARLEEHRRSVLHFQALARLGAQIQSVIA